MPYYQIVEERFIEEKEEDSLVGSESDEKAYIDAYIETEDDSVSILFFLDEWFGKKKSGTMLIHGEPGHGKTMLCRKAMVEFYRGKYLKGKAENVIAVSLNTGENRSIISEGKVLISNALAWGVEQEHRFTFEDCRGSLLFLDGFDEFIDDAKRTDVNIANICSFMKKVNNIAKTYGIHIVVLSRSVAVENDLKNLTGICKHFQLSPVSEIQQDEWLECHPEYSSYGETFQKIRKNSDMHVLLGVPLLFRLIVHNQFDETSSNVVDLYDKLFIHLMNKRNIYKDIELRLVEKELMTLAYEVYCTDSNMAVLENVIEDPHWLFTFYVKTSGNGKIGFFHRTFYQYFFAKFIFWGIINLKDKEEETFIGLFAERELDYTIRKYLSLLFNEENIPTVYSSAEKLIIALSQTEAYLNFEPHVDSGDAERSRIVRSENIYRNTLHIAASLSYVIQLPFKEKLELLMRTYNSTGIVLVSKKDKRADLSGVNLNGVYLCEADLSEADLRGADFELANLSKANLSRARLNQADFELSNLSGANLSRADLSGAYLSRANLNGADLFRANLLRAGLFRADLSGTDLRGADLRGADMGGADLRKANLRGANLTGVDLNGANLNGADLSGTDLSGVELFRASLSGANLSGANLSGADLSGANLIGADLRGADLNGTIIEVMKYKANLYRAKIDVRYKGKIDPSTEECSSIEWF